jgi:hypothetical protein
MLFTFDKHFDEALADPEVLRAHLVKLGRQRRVYRNLALFSAAVFFFCFFSVLWPSLSSNGKAIAREGEIGTAMMLFLTLLNTGGLLASQADIRTLKAYQKSQEQTSGKP